MQRHLWKYLTTSQHFSFWDFHRAQRYREFSFWSFQSSMRSQFVATCSFWSPSPPVLAWLSPCICIFSWPNCLLSVPVNLPLWSLNSLLTPCTRGEPSLMRAAWLNSLEPFFEGIEIILLTVMAYDHQMAIWRSLYYTIILTRHLCGLLVSVPWLGSFCIH